MNRRIAFLYGALCYASALATFAYAAGFIGNFATPTRLDSGAAGPVAEALLIDLALLVLFALQHSVMARPGFKRRFTRVVPPSVERSTYVLASSVVMFLLFWQWRPLGGVVWDLGNPLLRAGAYALYAGGWLLVLFATFVIDHFDLFGLRQVWLNLRRRVYEPVGFRTPGPYRIVRHPLYVGWLLVFWAAPTMTVSHLLFAIGTTAYILVAIRYEERDLTEMHAEYAEYRRRVPMLVPFARAKAEARVSGAEA